MKEAINSPYSGLIFRETFNDEATVRKNGGTPTAVTFADGKGTFNGTSSKINYNLGLNGTYSIRIRCKTDSTYSTNIVLIDTRGSNGDGVGNIWFTSSTNDINISAGKSYVNGSTASTYTDDVWFELCVTGISLNQGTGALLTSIGTRFSGTLSYKGDIDLVEIYQGTLTASEVANLYNNTWNKELSGYGGQIKGSNIVVNGDFSSATGWSTIRANFDITTNPGKGTVTATYANGYVYRTIPTVVGKKYKLITTLYGTLSSGSYAVQIRVGAGGAGSVTNLSSSYSFPTTDSVLVNEFVATDTTTYISLYNTGSGDVTVWDDVMCFEMNPKLLLDFDSTNGVLDLADYTNAATVTNVTIKKTGSNYAALFNGSSSKIDTGTDMIGTKAITLMSWFYNKWDVADNKFVRLIDNGKFLIQLQISDQIIVRGNGSTALLGTNGLIKKDKWIFMAVTRAIDGTTFIYMGDKNTAPYQDVTGNTGTPVVGTNNIIIGSDGGSNVWYGYIPKLTVVEGILPLTDITRFWSSTRREIL